MKTILLCLLVTYVTAQTQLGGKRCTWGPSYWCSHVSHAKACGAVEHCLSTVWKNQIIHPEKTDECIYCQFGFNELKEALENQEVQEEIAKYVSDVCKFLPDPDWKAICDGIVTEDLPIVIEMLDNKIKSETICAAIGMCSGLEDTYSPYGVLADKDKTEVKSSNSSCTDCMKFFQDVQRSIVSNETKSQLEQIFNQALCRRIPSFTTLCQDAVDRLLPVVLQFLADQLDPNIICRVFGFCVTSKYVDVIPLRNVFKDLKQPLKYRSSEECEACKDIMTEIVNTLRDESTQAVVKSDLETYVCDNLEALAGPCKQLVEEYLPQLFELLVNELDPTTVCEAVGLCTVPSSSLTIPALKIEPASLISNGYTANSLPCTICKIVMQEVDNFLRSNGTITMVEDLIDKICDKLPSEELKNECLSFVSEYGQMVIDDLAEEISPNATCTKLDLCTSKSSVSITNVKDLECDICVIGVVQLQKLLANVSTDDIVSDLRAACAFLPTNLSLTCVKYVDQYAPIAIDLLKSEKDPKALCQLAEICTTSYGGRHPYMTKPIPEDKVLSPTREKITSNVGVSVECEVCNTILFVLKELVENNATKEELEAMLEKVCADLGELKSVCDLVVKDYGEEIIDYLLKKLDPLQVCTKIGLCDSTPTHSLSLKAGILSPVDTLPIDAQEDKAQAVSISETKTFKGEAECEACMLVMEAADKALQQKYMQDKIKDLMLDVCKDLPHFHSECANLVNTYYMVAINYLVLSQSPASICKGLKLCTTAEKQPQPVNVKLSPVSSGKVEAGPECVICKLVMEELIKLIETNASEAEIRKALDKVCSFLPSTISEECNDLVNKYSDEIINLLVKELVDPKQVCAKLSLCSSNEMKGLATTVKILPAKNTAGDLECYFCKLIAMQVKKFLEENRTTEEIEGFLKNFCDYLPDTVSAQCEEVVDMYVPAIIDLFQQDFNSTQVCQEIGLCNATHNSVIRKEQHPSGTTAQKTDNTLFFKPQLLGREKCTYGPAFWCASKENAKICEAEEHCRRHVWN